MYVVGMEIFSPPAEPRLVSLLSYQQNAQCARIKGRLVEKGNVCLPCTVNMRQFVSVQYFHVPSLVSHLRQVAVLWLAGGSLAAPQKPAEPYINTGAVSEDLNQDGFVI